VIILDLKEFENDFEDSCSIDYKFPDKQYKLILADPPWSYNNKNTGGSLVSGASQKYPTMSLNEIKNLPIYDIAMNDSILFLWATTPLLPEAFDVMKAWGYGYKTSVYWYKLPSLLSKAISLGYWFRVQVEVCLVGIKGYIEPFRSQYRNMIVTKSEGHSRKPKELYEIIETIPNLNPKIELFARTRREGWDSWGNEI